MVNRIGQWFWSAGVQIQRDRPWVTNNHQPSSQPIQDPVNSNSPGSRTGGVVAIGALGTRLNALELDRDWSLQLATCFPKSEPERSPLAG
ncbi:MAG: hypothetical protein BJG00_018170 [Limnothrix sp. CACIAM 69d]|nr:MAG: hypothetical protein BJG00_018170 [Limnothrix sp. CACIAM 69d]